MEPTSFWAHWAWAAAASVIGLIFAGLLLGQYIKRQKPHQLAWFMGFLLYGLAAGMEAYSEIIGTWDHTIYRVYIVIAATLVGFLGLGSIYLSAKKRLWGHLFLIYTLIVVGLFFYGVFNTELIAEELVAGITVSGKPLGESGAFPRLYSMFLTIPGSLLLLGIALHSILKFSRNKEYRYRVWASILIAAGTIVIAGVGALARSGKADGLYPAEMIGAALLLWGFLKASTQRSLSFARESKMKNR